MKDGGNPVARLSDLSVRRSAPPTFMIGFHLLNNVGGALRRAEVRPLRHSPIRSSRFAKVTQDTAERGYTLNDICGIHFSGM